VGRRGEGTQEADQSLEASVGLLWGKGMTDSDFDAVDEILDNFDFHQVKQVTDLLNWQYFNVEGPLEVRDLRKMARKLLRDTVQKLDKEDGYDTGSGGFYVHGFKDFGNKYLELKFCVTEWNNHD
jgi:hypothetical protein